MAINYNQLGRLEFFDHRRMVEDLRHTFGHLTTSRGAAIRLPASVLTRLGQDMLNALPGDQGAYDLRYGVVDVSAFSRIEYGTAFFGNLPFDCLQAAILFGRTDLRSRFISDDGFDFDKALRWYVLHGIREHGLWHTVSKKFIQNLCKPSIRMHGGLISPLCHIVIGERPDIAEAFMALKSGKVEERFQDWLRNEGLTEYGLFWAVSRAEQQRFALLMRKNCAHSDNDPRILSSRIEKFVEFTQSDIRDISAKVNAVCQAEQELPWMLAQKEDGIDRLIVRGGIGDVSRLGIPLYSPAIKIGIPDLKFIINFVAIQMSTYTPRIDGYIQITNEGKIVAQGILSGVDNIFVIPVIGGGINAFRLSSIDIHFHSENRSNGSAPWAHLRRVWFL